MNINEAIESIDLRFKSGNDVPVQRASVTEAEWDVVRRYIIELRRLIGGRVELQVTEPPTSHGAGVSE